MACITEGAQGFPGLSGVIPPENGFLSEILVENGYSTFCVGKWHLTPSTEEMLAAPRRTWPLGRGFERFYGFLGGETNQYYPDLVLDQGIVDPPGTPEDGYHLSSDLCDRAIQFIGDTVTVAPDKPWLCYLSFGANHAPHHAPKEWVEQYAGVFDMGYEKYREIVLANMKKLGIVPENTQLSPINPWPAPDVISEADVVRPWESLGPDEKKLFCRMAETYAGFSSYTDHQLGRVLDFLESTGQLENTIVVVVSDNGASGEGSPNGSVNENRFFNNWPDSLEDNLRALDQLGSPATYNHYPTGWAWAFNTPYKMFKRYSFEGGTADPFMIAWPKGLDPKTYGGHVRDQYCHAVDVVPTILDLAGIEPPSVIKGATQSALDGVSLVPALRDAKITSPRTTQMYSMLGTRALYHDGWKAVAKHGAISGKGNFHADEWELYHVASDRSESTNLAAEHPERLRALVSLWFAEAGRNDALPLEDRTAAEILTTERPSIAKVSTRAVYYPGMSEVPEEVAIKLRNRSFVIGASLRDVQKGCEGVILSQGSRFGGYTLFVQNGKLVYLYNFLGIEQFRFESSDPLPTGRVTVAVHFEKKGENPKFVANGALELRINKKVVAKGTMRTQPGALSLSGEGLNVGRDRGDPVSPSYRAPFAFRNGVIEFVAIDTSGESERDLAREFAAMLSRD
ncbi:Arylsulfatase [Sandaracinus amylolyticus]|uniref:Arylsulfatase n=2 Tax=Sandaracinus amylolyticus TaxID=927083 RepID=A0A0F6W6E2_9BACT|nr:Arylsulfatase [Sandaracinus amylolyticus]